MTLYRLFCRNEGEDIWHESETEPTVCPTCGSSNITLKTDYPTEGGIKFSDYTEKQSPVSADVMLIEDSENSGSKKMIELGNIPVTIPTMYAPSINTIMPQSGATFGTNTNGYLLFGIYNSYTSVEANGQVRMPKCKVTGIAGRCAAVTDQIEFTVRKNGVDTSLTGTVTATGHFYISGDVDFADGDLLSIYFEVLPGDSFTHGGLQLHFKSEVA